MFLDQTVEFLVYTAQSPCFERGRVSCAFQMPEAFLVVYVRQRLDPK